MHVGMCKVPRLPLQCINDIHGTRHFDMIFYSSYTSNTCVRCYQPQWKKTSDVVGNEMSELKKFPRHAYFYFIFCHFAPNRCVASTWLSFILCRLYCVDSRCLEENMYSMHLLIYLLQMLSEQYSKKSSTILSITLQRKAIDSSRVLYRVYQRRTGPSDKKQN